LHKFSESLGKVAPYLNIGGIFAGCLLIGVFLGRYLDGKWDTEPLMLLIGSFLGIASGFYHFFKIVLHLNDVQRKHGDKDNDDETKN